MAASVPEPSRRPRHPVVLATLLVLLVLCALGFIALGAWQIERLAWKTELIGRVEQRLAAAPVAAPRHDAAIDRASDEYRRVTVTGTFAHDRETLVRASTELGTGWWVLTPLRQADGTWVLVNRGFVPPEQAREHDRPNGVQRVDGLLRLSEPAGSLLQHNDAGANRWYSRDVAAIAQARGVAPVAAYFVDAASSAPADAAAWPRPGLTVVRFSNNHRVYAVTWFILAAMSVAAAVLVWRLERRG